MGTALTFIHATILGVAATLFVAAAASDVRSYRIPNCLCALLLTGYPLYVLTAPNPVDWKGGILMFAIVFAIGFACFLGNILGAGDVKLLSVASLWAGPALISTLLIVTAFAGGLESLAATIVKYAKSEKAKKNSRLKERRKKKSSRLNQTQIPYGVAIAAGGLTVLGMMAHPLLVQPG